jgi:aminoglycoside phosphotransferase (APT) family kinase protein
MNDALQTWIEERHPGARLTRTWPLTGGVSAVMIGFEAADADERSWRYILRFPGKYDGQASAEGARKEYATLSWLAERGVAAPRPFLLDAEGARFGDPAIVLDFTEGAPDWDPRDPAAYAEAMADTLAQLHTLRGAEGIAELRRRTPERILGWLRDATFELEADKLYAKRLEGIPRQVNESVLLHGDYWPGNVLWRDGRLVAVIDWEEAGVGDPLADLAVTRLDMLWILDEAAMERFTAHYLSLTGIDATALPYWDLFAALRPGVWLAKWAEPWPHKGRPDVTVEAMAAKLKLFAANAMAKMASG